MSSAGAEPVVLYEIADAQGWLTGTMPKLGEMHRIDKDKNEVGVNE